MEPKKSSLHPPKCRKLHGGHVCTCTWHTCPCTLLSWPAPYCSYLASVEQMCQFQTQSTARFLSQVTQVMGLFLEQGAVYLTPGVLHPKFCDSSIHASRTTKEASVLAQELKTVILPGKQCKNMVFGTRVERQFHHQQ